MIESYAEFQEREALSEYLIVELVVAGFCDDRLPWTQVRHAVQIHVARRVAVS